MTVLLCVSALGLLAFSIGAIGVTVSIPANDPVRVTATWNMMCYAGLSIHTERKIVLEIQ
jgi:hypothetical protein